jgi:hypothetical protein
MRVVQASVLMTLFVASCQTVPTRQPSYQPASASNSSGSTSSKPESKGPVPWAKLDELRSRFSGYQWAGPQENPALGVEFAAIRKSAGWMAFSQALRTCDDAVNALLDEDILDWSNSKEIIGKVNSARNAWRHACTWGIKPPTLAQGWTTFDENGMNFQVYVASQTYGSVVVRSQRGQVLGIFDLQLQVDGRSHIVAHMLERALRYPDTYLSYPWDIVMATDTIFVDDIWVELDRVQSQVRIQERTGGPVTTK